MKHPSPDDLSNLSMVELFRVEAENQTTAMTSGLLELEREPDGVRHLEALMRAAHSLKGAARIINLEVAVNLAHAMEDCFVAAQHGKIKLRKSEIDVLFRAIDLLLHFSKRSETEVALWETQQSDQIRELLVELTQITLGRGRPDNASEPIELQAVRSEDAPRLPLTSGASDGVDISLSTPAVGTARNPRDERVLRLTAESLNRLLALAGESLVESRWLHPFAESLQRLKRLQSDLSLSLESFRESLDTCELTERADSQLAELTDRLAECRQFLGDRLVDLEMYDRRSANLSHRLYLEVLQCRMRPFGDGIRRFPRMVRDLARTLGKEVRLEVTGDNTQVDRDILDKLEAPLGHLLRNAVDHGCETPEERRRLGKPAEGLIRIEARHIAGMLVITVSDDGPGVEPARLRETILQKRLVSDSVAEKLTEPELLEFLLLPGFTLRNTVTEISGRGVGLDVVQNTVKSVRGTVRIITNPGRGMRFQLHLPLTLSVLRTLLVEVAGEPYAIPLSQIARTLKLPREQIEAPRGRHCFTFGEQKIALITAHQVLGRDQPSLTHGAFPVVILGDRNSRFGLVVDRLLGERELVVQTLDPRLGKIKDISAGSLMEDGSPVLIVDVDDMLRSIEKLISSGQLDQAQQPVIDVTARRVKRILAIDDSLTVRELERKLLTGQGYVTDVAVDGMDGWNAVRAGDYDLVITDVDLPRMDGIELTTLIKQDARLKSLPVLVVSYKDRKEDRLRGLEAGADYYLAKGGFQDDLLLRAVVDLIGEAEE
ncbi:MAG TPA: hybrid sensor histidine kinase/response regulator [Verrucomicrobiae bacterium]|nr:hybrid sensor histidine kinase/response regulator [Verrucomicrobiae bacterium]